MTPQVTTMPIAEALTDVRSLSDALEDLRRRAEAYKRRGNDSTAAYMLGRASRWPRAWLRRVMQARAEAYRMHSHHADGAGGCRG